MKLDMIIFGQGIADQRVDFTAVQNFFFEKLPRQPMEDINVIAENLLRPLIVS